MHELGHNLGLRHGGVDIENYKPNHLSVMSYLNQVDWLIKNCKPFLDFERFDMTNLNETKLDERLGLSLRGRDGPLARYGVRWLNNGVLMWKGGKAHTKVDWNNNGSGSSAASLSTSTISAALVCCVADTPEWDNLVFDGGNIGVIGQAEKRAVDIPTELTFEDYQRQQRRVLEVQ